MSRDHETVTLLRRGHGFAPCVLAQAPHTFGPWRVFQTGRGVVERRTCTQCGTEETRSEES